MPSLTEEIRSKWSIFPQRYFMGLLGCFVLINCYTMRISMSNAINRMVKPDNLTQHYKTIACPEYNKPSLPPPHIPNITYDWDHKAQFIIVHSFFWGYLIGQLPGGVIADQYGAKYVIGVSVLVMMCLTLITPVTIQYTNGNLIAVTILRILIGLAQGTVLPALNAMLAHWVPRRERATISSLTYAGVAIGTLTNNISSNALIGGTGTWSSIFYVYGSFGGLCFIIWMLLAYSSPDEHPHISAKEKEYLHSELGDTVTRGKKQIPWSRIIFSVPLWALLIGHMGLGWGWFILITHLPKYMEEVLQFNIREEAAWSSFPYMMTTIVVIMSGYLCDFLVNRDYLKTTTTRKLFATLGAMGPAVFLLMAAYSGCNRIAAVILFTISISSIGFYCIGLSINALDLSPNFAGILVAFASCGSIVAGALGPFIAERLIKNHTLHEWREVFWTTLIVLTVTNIVFVIFGSSQVQYWNNLTPEEVTEDHTEESSN